MISGKCTKCNKTLLPSHAHTHFKKCILQDITGGSHKSFLLRVYGLPAHWVEQYLLEKMDKPVNFRQLHRLYESKKYWMYLRIKASATLDDLDLFLRDMWLECCGHLSTFEIRGTNYERPYDELESSPHPVRTTHIRVDNIFEKGLKFTYMYDFGSDTNLKMTVNDEYHDTKSMRAPIVLLARNNAPKYTCSACGSLGSLVCIICASKGMEPYFCISCGKKHEKQKTDSEHYLFKTVNSPRMGECAYEIYSST